MHDLQFSRNGRLAAHAFAAAAMLIAIPLAARPAAATEIIFADIFTPRITDGSIRRVGTDGSGLDTVLTTGGGLRSLALDPAAGKVYWTDVDNFVIRRANLDGSDQEDLVTSGLAFPSAIALDLVNGKMYWGDQVNEEIRRANLDGTDNEFVISTPFHRGIAVDAVNGKVYWTTSITQFRGDIRRADLDGANPQAVVTSLDAQFKPAAIALDVAGGKIYWTDYVVDVVRRANLNGTGQQDLFPVGANFNPRGIALDLEAGKVYWGQDVDFKGTAGLILRMNLDGTSAQTAVGNLGLVNDLGILPTVDCPADLDGNGTVNSLDLGILLSSWSIPPSASGCGGALPCAADLNHDGFVNSLDLGVLLSSWSIPAGSPGCQ